MLPIIETRGQKMSRNIPQVRTWRVTWYSGAITVAFVTVRAPTKLLARLAVMDALCEPQNTLMRERFLNARARNAIDRVTYGIVRAPNMCGRR
jgi:hypothetical protein